VLDGFGMEKSRVDARLVLCHARSTVARQHRRAHVR
jgi:hypothetical protein